jgi:hypothetical protein
MTTQVLALHYTTPFPPHYALPATTHLQQHSNTSSQTPKSTTSNSTSPHGPNPQRTQRQTSNHLEAARSRPQAFTGDYASLSTRKPFSTYTSTTSTPAHQTHSNAPQDPQTKSHNEQLQNRSHRLTHRPNARGRPMESLAGPVCCRRINSNSGTPDSSSNRSATGISCEGAVGDWQDSSPIS